MSADTLGLEEILQLFRRGEGQELLEEKVFEEDMVVALRVTLQVGRALLQGHNVISSWSAIDSLRLDIRSAFESYETIEQTVSVMRDQTLTISPWPSETSLDSMVNCYGRDLQLLSMPDITIQQRYGALVRLIRWQLILWGVTFAGSQGGYVF